MGSSKVSEPSLSKMPVVGSRYNRSSWESTSTISSSVILLFSSVQEDDIRKAFEKIREQHGAVVNSKEVIGVKVAQPIDRTGEGNGTRERQETRAGIQDGSYMQVKHVQTLIHFHFH